MSSARSDFLALLSVYPLSAEIFDFEKRTICLKQKLKKDSQRVSTTCVRQVGLSDDVIKNPASLNAGPIRNADGTDCALSMTNEK
jgi:hypothetical protein